MIMIIIIGVVQDLVFRYLDKEFFPYKYQTKEKYSNKLTEPRLWDMILSFVFKIFVWILIAIYMLFIKAEFSPGFLGVQPLSYFFGDTVWAIHTIFACVLFYKTNKPYRKFVIERKPLVENHQNGGV